MMEKLIYILKNLPPSGKRLDGGLALRLSRGNGWAVLGCSRVGQMPSEQEMETICKAVVEVWRPAQVWRGGKGKVLVVKGEQVEHFIWRLYWTLETLELVYELSIQSEFVF